MAKKFKEIVLRPFRAYERDWAKGDLFRTVSITERDAAFLNDRKDDFGFEYIEVVEEKPKEAKVVFELPDDENEVQTKQETMEVPKPKRGFPQKKQ